VNEKHFISSKKIEKEINSLVKRTLAKKLPKDRPNVFPNAI